jgi:triacylglycerol esterase/lipase EstA (alpha/beta hydrolase family)
MRLRRGAVALAVVAGACLGAAAAAPAASGPYAPLNRPGPRLSVPAEKLKAALSCTSGVEAASRNPILLVPGTDLDPGPNYSWNYERAFVARHWPYCAVTLPFHTTGDIQIAAQYLVYAIRTMALASARRVDILGYSQGGMLPRWALRFWPDTRPLVHEVVSLDPSNHGTLDADATCQGQCSPADWQQESSAHFIDALNSFAETFAGIDYTVIFSHTDEIVVPNLDASGSSALHTGGGKIVNVAVQQVCPGDTSEHLAMGSYDAVGYALAVDAFSRGDVADPARIPASVCTQPFQPGVDPSTFASDYGNYLSAIGQAQSSVPQVDAEPPLACYVFASCRTTAPPPRRAAHPNPKHKHHKQKHHRRHKQPAKQGRGRHNR